MAKKCVLLLLIALICLDYCVLSTVPRPYDPSLNDETVLTAKKRPFCNAFTGCGRKRSDLTPGSPQEMFREKQFEDTVPYQASENSMDISRQIVKAKLWEAIQEASELARRQRYSYNE